jgi:ribosomal protein S18 acetylase RimI-like enzyme
MSKFILTIDKTSVATQVANLLNTGGQLRTFMNLYGILNNNVVYVVKLYSETVVGVIGLEVKNQLVTELKHLCIHPNHRRKGIGKELLSTAIQYSKTQYVYGTVRSNNPNSIRNNLSVGMKPVAKYLSGNYYIIIFAGRKNEIQRNILRSRNH